MGWIISTCILGVLLLLAVAGFIIFFVYIYYGVERLKDENTDYYIENKRLKSEIQKANEIFPRKNRTIVELRAKLEQTNKIIDRLTNMNAPQPVMEPQIIQNIA